MRRSGEIFALVTDPWDAERVKGDIRTELALALALDLEAALRASCGGEKVAVAGLELMEARFVKAEGASDNFMLISSGGAEVRGMKPPTERRFREGDVVATELTPCVDGFYAQICRSLIIGEPSQAQIEAFDIFKKARQAGEDALRPGVNICDVARAENDVFREAGLGTQGGLSCFDRR